MATHGRRRLRDLFDESPSPHIAHPPRTHQRDFYVATDGSFAADGSGLGVIIETRSGERVARVSLPDDAPDNNVAEYRALHLGLDVLDARTPTDATVGLLVDHDQLAANVNSVVLADRHTDYQPLKPLSVPPQSHNHWRGIRARVAGFDAVRAARIDSDHNPAHPLANAPDRYAHVNEESPRCPLVTAVDDGEPQIPPPSRSDRRASD